MCIGPVSGRENIFAFLGKYNMYGLMWRSYNVGMCVCFFYMWVRLYAKCEKTLLSPSILYCPWSPVLLFLNLTFACNFTFPFWFITAPVSLFGIVWNCFQSYSMLSAISFRLKNLKWLPSACQKHPNPGLTFKVLSNSFKLTLYSFHKYLLGVY